MNSKAKLSGLISALDFQPEEYQTYFDRYTGKFFGIESRITLSSTTAINPAKRPGRATFVFFSSRSWKSFGRLSSLRGPVSFHLAIGGIPGDRTGSHHFRIA
jgi:hypothetical protein